MKRSLKRTSLSGMLLIALMVVAGGCGQYYSSSVITSTFDRNSETTVSNSSGLNVKIEATYIGKSPEPPSTNEIARDWKNEDTDFFHYRIENRSSNPIVLTSITFALEEVRNGEVYETRDADAILKEFGTTDIAAGTTVIRSNSWVWGKNGQSRTLIKTYHGEFEGDEIELPVKLIYRKGE